MKNLDINNLKNAELVRGIIRLTNTTNNILRSCRNNLEYRCLAESALRTRRRELLEKQFEQAWEWFYNAVCDNYDVIDADIDKYTLDVLKAKSENAFVNPLEGLKDRPNFHISILRLKVSLIHLV